MKTLLSYEKCVRKLDGSFVNFKELAMSLSNYPSNLPNIPHLSQGVQNKAFR